MKEKIMGLDYVQVREKIFCKPTFGDKKMVENEVVVEGCVMTRPSLATAHLPHQKQLPPMKISTLLRETLLNELSCIQLI